MNPKPLKRREAMLLARGIVDVLLTAVVQQGKGREAYTLTHEQMKKLSADAIVVTEFLVLSGIGRTD